MNIHRTNLRMSLGWLSALFTLALCGQIAQAQVQRKPKAPKPPSYDDVMQRALSEKKATSNAPVVIPPAPKVEPVIASPAPTSVAVTNTPVISLDDLLKEAKASQAQTVKPAPVIPEPQAAVVATPQVETKPQPTAMPPTVAAPVVANPVATAPVAPAPVVRTEAVPTVNAPAQAVVFPEPTKTVKQTAKTKGPVFSPLPPDLAPINEVAKVQALPIRASAAVLPEGMDALDDKHQLAIGDQLSFRIVEDEEDPKQLTVMDSGELEVPYIGRFNAVGKSCKELAKALKAELEKEYYYKATVIVAVDLMARSRGKVYLVGPVRMPGPQEIPSDESFTISKAILRAGGFSDFADKKNVKITRKALDGVNETHITVDVTEILEQGRTGADVPLLPGDLIYIPERLIRF